MATITINRSDIRDLLLAESTNASRTMKREDGVSDFEGVVIDDQADSALDGVWKEANAKLTEKMHRFLTGSSVNNTSASYVIPTVPDMLTDNIKMYIVDWMMADWLSAVRPDYSKRYYDRAALQMDDLLRKLYKKEPPV